MIVYSGGSSGIKKEETIIVFKANAFKASVFKVNAKVIKKTVIKEKIVFNYFINIGIKLRTHGA